MLSPRFIEQSNLRKNDFSIFSHEMVDANQTGRQIMNQNFITRHA
jgi:hypothetical protein